MGPGPSSPHLIGSDRRAWLGATHRDPGLPLKALGELEIDVTYTKQGANLLSPCPYLHNGCMA